MSAIIGRKYLDWALCVSFLKNCYICFNGWPTNSILESSPPTLAEYLPLDEELEMCECVIWNGGYNYGN